MGGYDDLLSRLLNSGPSQGTLLIVLEKLREEGRIHEVIQQGKKAQDIYPDNARLRRLLAESYLEAGFIGQAEEELTAIASELKALSSALKLQAELFARQSRKVEAVEALRVYLAHHPGDPDAEGLLNSLTPPEEVSTGEESLPADGAPEAHEKAELAGLATPTLAEIYFNQGQTREAIATYEKVLEKNPGDEISRDRLSRIRASLTPAETPLPPPDQAGDGKKAKLLSALEGWLLKIQELNRAG